MPLPDRRPDAVTVPRPYKRLRDPHEEFRRVFAKAVFESPRAYARAQTNQYFITADPDDSLHFPIEHDLGGGERYDWYVVAADVNSPANLAEKVESWRDRPEAVKFGWKVDEQAAQPPSADRQAAFQAEVTAKMEGLKAKARRMYELAQRPAGDLHSDEAKELEELKAFIG